MGKAVKGQRPRRVTDPPSSFGLVDRAKGIPFDVSIRTTAKTSFRSQF